jgi:enterochelin esterase-like enzyme
MRNMSAKIYWYGENDKDNGKRLWFLQTVGRDWTAAAFRQLPLDTAHFTSKPSNRDEAPATRAPTATLALALPEGSNVTPTSTETPEATPSPRAELCHASGGQLSVSFVDSSILARRVPYSLYLPPCYETERTRRYPVLYLLHGANADHTQWPDLNVLPDADALIAQGTIAPLVVVMPGGDYRQGEDYGTFVLRDLIPHVEQTLRVAPDRHDRAIGGLSQGGYWALELALAHPDLFDAVGGHSPATGPALSDLLVPDRASGLSALRIYLDVGNADPLAPGVTAFAATLQAHGLAVVFHIYPGAHNRPYWRSHTAEYLAFYAQDW